MTDIDATHSISVVIPVYQGEQTLSPVVEELANYFTPQLTQCGHRFQVREVLLVHDRGGDASDRVMRELAERFSFVRPVWLSRNFGQHAATLAGMASSGGDWIVTMDEDGQHDPAYIPSLLDTAMHEQAQVVYASPINEAPHGSFRNAASRGAKWVGRAVFRLEGSDLFQSYRLVLGEVGRSVAAYAGTGIYLDVAMRWVTARVAVAPVALRDEGGRRSGYSTRTLLSHFWRMVLSSGTRGLRVVSLLGTTFGILGAVLALYVLIGTIAGTQGERGWASMMVVVCLGVGALLFSLGVVAEYIGVAVNMAMGRPLYLIVSDIEDGPLGRRPVAALERTPSES